MSDLVTWLRAQLDEDERVARAAGAVAAPPWRWAHQSGPLKYGLVGTHPVNPRLDAWVVPAASPDVYPHRDTAAHMECWDPARVLAEVETKRRILDAYLPAGADPHPGLPCINYPDQDPAEYDEYDSCHRHVEANRYLLRHDHVVRLLALPYADRPGYRAEWRP